MTAGRWLLLVAAITVAGCTVAPPSSPPDAATSSSPATRPTNPPIATQSVVATSEPEPDPTPVALAAVAFRQPPERPLGADCEPADITPIGLEREMTLGGSPIVFQFLSGGPRGDGPGGWDDLVPGPEIRFDVEEEHQVIEARSGDVLQLWPDASVSLIRGHLQLYGLDPAGMAEGGGGLLASTDLGGDVAGLSVPMPLVAGTWLLTVSATWQSDCQRGSGYVDLLLVVDPAPPPVPLATIEVRPLPERPMGADCSAADPNTTRVDPSMLLDATPFDLNYQSSNPRDGRPGGWADGVVGPTSRFDFQDEHVIVTARPNAVGRLEPNATVSLVQGRIELYALDQNDQAEGGGGRVASAVIGGDARGLDVPMPQVSGRWLWNVYVTWQTDCLHGDAYADLLLVVD